MKPFLSLLFLLTLPCLSHSAHYFVDPINGSDSNNGSSATPWKNLQKLFDNNQIESRNWNSLPYTASSYLVAKNSGAPIKGGDTLFLRSGNYGELNISSYYNSADITLIADAGHNPVFRNIIIRSSSHWILRGLFINPSTYAPSSFSNLISLESHGWTGPIHTIETSASTLASVSNSSGWTKNDWNTKAKNGIRVDGRNMRIINNRLTNVNFGISVGASHSLIERNTIENFAGDGLRGLGDYTTFQYNTVKNCYDVNDNHDDGFQSWSRGSDGKVGTGTVKGIVLRGNTIINFEDSNQPFRGTLQGIGCFDGMFEDWVVEKNIVRVDHWHGISLYGAINATIQDNIVTDPNGRQNIGPPWIRINPHKNGTPSRDNLVSCNIAPKIIVEKSTNTVQYNTLSETGGPRHSGCPALNMVSPILPLLLDRSD